MYCLLNTLVSGVVCAKLYEYVFDVIDYMLPGCNIVLCNDKVVRFMGNNEDRRVGPLWNKF